MTPLAIALTLTAAAPTLSPAPQVTFQLDRPSSAQAVAPPCRDIDPAFVHVVAPPPGAGPLWAARLEARTAPAMQAHFGCPRLVAVVR